MNDEDLLNEQPSHISHPRPSSRKPRLVLMGEFSAGKSTLSNILLGSQPLPMRVTATRLPPVKISYGQPAAFAIDLQGKRSRLDLNDLETVSLYETEMIELTMEAETLQHCDLVDMPGISDPNMPQHFWQDVVRPCDHVIWCTHATQAWRQSEAAIWNMLQPMTSGVNLLLITQFDKLQTERDRMRVFKRVERETRGLFNAIYPVSLLQALNANDDKTVWTNSGAAAFTDHVARMLASFAKGEAPDMDDVVTGAESAAILQEQAVEASNDQPETVHAEEASRITPRRVQLHAGDMPRDRPERRAATGTLGRF